MSRTIVAVVHHNRRVNLDPSTAGGMSMTLGQFTSQGSTVADGIALSPAASAGRPRRCHGVCPLANLISVAATDVVCRGAGVKRVHLVAVFAHFT